MKRWVAFFLITAIAGLFVRMDKTGTDVATLEPVKLLYVTSQNGTYYLTTDTGQQGRGNTVDGAIANLKAVSAGKIYLNTAEHLLISSSAWESVGRFAGHLRPDCTVTISKGEPDVEKASPFLDTHKPEFTLNDLRAGARNVPVLYCRGGGMLLEKT